MARRLLLSYLSLTLLVLIALDVPFALTYAGEQHQRATRAVEGQATALAESAEERIERGEKAKLSLLAASYSRRTGGSVLIVDRHGQPLAAAGRLSPDEANPARLPEVRTALAGRETVGVRHATGTNEIYYVTVPSVSGPIVRGAIRLAVPNSSLDATVHRMWNTLAVAGEAILAAVAVLGYLLARSITRPVRQLERATSELARGSVTTAAATDVGPPELRRLAARFNRTATRLQQLMATQASFAADASHQLRTPLTALRLRLENLEPNLDIRGQRDLDAAVAEIDRLGRMVEGLLALANLDDEGTRPEPVDLDAVIAERLDVWAGPAGAERVRIDRTGGGAGRAWAIPGAVEQILDNLLANALRATPPESTITVNCHPMTGAEGAMVAVHVIDQGPGMSPEQRARAFDRFWRAPDAGKGGSGLGLTIVQRLAHASGGQVELRPAPGTGLDATLILPSAPPVPPQRGHRRHFRHAAASLR